MLMASLQLQAQDNQRLTVDWKKWERLSIQQLLDSNKRKSLVTAGWDVLKEDVPILTHPHNAESTPIIGARRGCSCSISCCR